MDNDLQPDYINKINNVFTYIDKNLNGDLSLDTLSKIAYFSPFHFHRIFKTMTGETLNEYVIRKRIEKTAGQLMHRKHINIKELSLKNGFSASSSFTRSFKKFYGVSPTEFRKQHSKKYSKISQLKSKIGQDNQSFENYICNIINLKKWIAMNAKIEIKKMPKLDVAYVTSLGPQNLPSAFGKLIKWATPKGLMTNQEVKLGTIYYDSFKVTEYHKVRLSAFIVLNETTEVVGDIGLTTLEKGKYIVGSYQISVDEYEKSWTGLFIWMNENGYKMAPKLPFEIYHNNFNEHPQKISIVDFYIPIE